MKTKTKSKRAKVKTKAKLTNIVFLLDRTGSMGETPDKLNETISAFNAYLDGLRKDKKAAASIRFTLVQFNSESIDTIYKSVKLDKVAKRNLDNYVPGAMTPLYDAMGQTISSMLEEKSKDVLFITLTDGLNNASSHWTLDGVKDLMRKMESKHGWNFVHIGVGDWGWSACQTIAQGTQSHNNVLKTNHTNIKRSLARAGGQSVSYAIASSFGDQDEMKAYKSDFFSGKKDDTK